MDLWSVFMVPLLLLIAANDLTTAGMEMDLSLDLLSSIIYNRV